MIKTLETIEKELKKECGDTALIGMADDIKILGPKFIPGGIYALDITTGGIPKGRSVIYWGDQSSGKSTASLHAAASFQRTCRNCFSKFKTIRREKSGELIRKDCNCNNPYPMKVAYQDNEKNYDATWFTKCGVFLDKLLIIKPSYAESAIDSATKVVRSRDCDLLIIDSIVQLGDLEELAKSAEESTMGKAPRIIGRATRQFGSAQNILGTVLGEADTSIILINQMRNKIGGFGNPETMTGGFALGHYAAQIIQFRKKAVIKSKSGVVIGHDISFTTVKNHLGAPYRKGECSLYSIDTPYYKSGQTNYEVQVVLAATSWGILEKSGSWYSYNNERVGQGKEKVGMYLREHNDLLEEIKEKIQEHEDLYINCKIEAPADLQDAPTSEQDILDL